MPTRRSGHDPEVVARWDRRRRQVGARVREVRIAAGLTQEALALESGLSRNQIIELEWGRSSVMTERLFDLAAALEVDVRELLAEPSSEPVPAVYRGGRTRQSRSPGGDPAA